MRTYWKALTLLTIVAPPLWFASEWWEKGLATPVEDKQFVSNDCAYVQTFKPFWVLPNILHPKRDPNGDIPQQWLTGWGYPGFYRLFDSRSGVLLGETDIYDLEHSSGGLWEDSKGVYAGIIYIGPTVKSCTAKPSR